MAVHEDARMQTRGIRLLRAAGDRDVLLRACYWRSNIGTDAASALFNTLGAKVSENAAQEIYYRVTGTPFNAVKPPRVRTGRGTWRWDEFDFNVGGDAVQSRIRGLSLNDSRVDNDRRRRWRRRLHGVDDDFQERVHAPAGSARPGHCRRAPWSPG